MRRGWLIVALIAGLARSSAAQPGGADPLAGSGSGSAADPAPGSAAAPDPATGSGAGTPGSPVDPATGSGSAGSVPDPATGSGSAGSGAVPDPSTGSGSASSGAVPAPSTGSGSASSAGPGSGAAGSGSGSGPKIIQLPTDANAPQVSAAASPTVVRLGGKFTLFVTATYGEGVEVNLREPIELGGGFEVTRKLSADKPAGDGRKTREWQIEVIAWDLGDLVMPPVAVTYTAFGRADQVATNTVKLRVEGVLGDVVDDPKTMRDHAPPKILTSRDWFWLWALIGTGVAIGTIVALLQWRQARKRRVVRFGGGMVAMPRNLDTASARALEQLLTIERSGVLDREAERKQGHAELVEVIREYLGSRYRVITADQTSSELLKRLAPPVAPVEEHAMISAWLERCDLVKYAGLHGSLADAKQTLEDARALVLTTTQQPAETAARTLAQSAAAPGGKEAA